MLKMRYVFNYLDDFSDNYSTCHCKVITATLVGRRVKKNAGILNNTVCLYYYILILFGKIDAASMTFCINKWLY